MDKYTMDKYRPSPGTIEDDVNLSRIPVFVFPASVFFNARDRDHLKQLLTIYNPYEFPIRFKVLSNAPDTYTVIDPEGSIKSKNCVDLILRVSDVPAEGGSVLEHKFRVQIYHYNDRKIIGRRDIPSVIHWGILPPHLVASEAGLGDFQQVTAGQSGLGLSSRLSRSGSITSKELTPTTATQVGGNRAGTGGGGGRGMGIFLSPGQQPNYVVIITALVCIIGLMLPISDPENSGKDLEISATTSPSSSSSSQISISSLIPNYLHVTVNQKLLAAYVLGLVTMVIFRP